MVESKLRIIIIGGGVAGIILASELKRKLGVTASIMERNGDFGGTWLVNKYPGCASDVPAPWYSWSREPNPRWSSVYPPQPELLAYWLAVARKHDLYRQAHFRINFISAEWDEKTSTYKCVFEDLVTGEQKIVVTDVLVSCVGAFSQPRTGPKDIEGFDVFEGEVCHSARWKEGIDLFKKRVAVIGNGCSAIQIIPEISKDSTTQIVNFARSPAYIIPRRQYEFPVWMTFIFTYVPFALLLFRFSVWFYFEKSYWIFETSHEKDRKNVEDLVRGYMKTAPKKYHDTMIPNYEIGCKRIIFDPGYLQALHRPNVELTFNPIESFTPTGIRTKDGKDWPFDVIITATGFEVGGESMALDWKGIGGISLHEQWTKQGGPQAYRATSISNFPNAYIILGPNVATGTSSVVYSNEIQIEMVIRLIEPLVKYQVKAITVKPAAEDAYNQQIQKELESTVFNGSCTAWYKKEGDGKLTVPYPGPLIKFWWANRGSPRWEDFIQIGGTKRLGLADYQKSK